MDNQTQSSLCFQDPEWLKGQVYSILNFYYPRCMDYKNGGYYNCFLDNGTICDYETKHLVGTSRFIYIFSIGAILGNRPSWCVDCLEHGLKFLQQFHLDQKNGGYYWSLKGKKVTDATKFAYGHAFVLISASKAYQAGISYAKDIIEYTYKILEDHFWEPEYKLYADEISSDWSKVSSYRGQNCNMHLCEGMIAAYEATSDEKYIKRAYELAKSVTVNLASQYGGLIWENYNSDWRINWNYYETEESLRQFRPSGFVPGHSIEWSKLLLMLERHCHKSWLLEKSEYLYNAGLSKGLDNKYYGISYLLSREGKVINTDKYYWVMAEAIGASAILAATTNSDYYTNIYNSIFSYSYTFFVDKIYGGWYNKLNRENKKYSDIKSPVTKTDYHPIANYYEAIKSLTKYIC